MPQVFCMSVFFTEMRYLMRLFYYNGGINDASMVTLSEVATKSTSNVMIHRQQAHAYTVMHGLQSILSYRRQTMVYITVLLASEINWSCSWMLIFWLLLILTHSTSWHSSYWKAMHFISRSKNSTEYKYVHKAQETTYSKDRSSEQQDMQALGYYSTWGSKNRVQKYIVKQCITFFQPPLERENNSSFPSIGFACEPIPCCKIWLVML